MGGGEDGGINRKDSGDFSFTRDSTKVNGVDNFKESLASHNE